MITKEKAIEYLQTIIEDADSAAETLESGEKVEWDADSFLAIAQLAEVAKRYIERN